MQINIHLGSTAGGPIVVVEYAPEDSVMTLKKRCIVGIQASSIIDEYTKKKYLEINDIEFLSHGFLVDNNQLLGALNLQEADSLISLVLMKNMSLVTDSSDTDAQSLEQSQRVNIVLKDLAISVGILFGSIAIGAGIGVFLGTFAFPLLGTALGAMVCLSLGSAIGVSVSSYQLLNWSFVKSNAEISWPMFGLTTVSIATSGFIIGSLLFPGVGSAIGAGVGFCVGALIAAITSPGIRRWICNISLESTPTQANNQESNDVENEPGYSNLYTNEYLQFDPQRKNKTEEEEEGNEIFNQNTSMNQSIFATKLDKEIEDQGENLVERLEKIVEMTEQLLDKKMKAYNHI